MSARKFKQTYCGILEPMYLKLSIELTFFCDECSEVTLNWLLNRNNWSAYVCHSCNLLSHIDFKLICELKVFYNWSLNGACICRNWSGSAWTIFYVLLVSPVEIRSIPSWWRNVLKILWFGVESFFPKWHLGNVISSFVSKTEIVFSSCCPAHL